MWVRNCVVTITDIVYSLCSVASVRQLFKSGVWNLFNITGGTNCSLSLAGRTTNELFPEILLLSNYEKK